jgi:hypothetical protein
MLFFFKKKKIVIDCLTNKIAIFDLFPPVKNIEVKPDWWKKLPSAVDVEIPEAFGATKKQATIKRCDGILELFKTGFVLPLWSDMTVITTRDGNLAADSSAELNVIIETHPRFEYGEEFDSYIHAKFVSPWFFREKTGASFYMTSAFWHQTQNWKNIIQTPGVLNFRDNIATNINTFLPKRDFKIYLKAGTPLVHFIPLFDYDYEIRPQLLNDSEMYKLHQRYSYKMSYLGKYNNN